MKMIVINGELSKVRTIFYHRKVLMSCTTEFTWEQIMVADRWRVKMYLVTKKKKKPNRDEARGRRGARVAIIDNQLSYVNEPVCPFHWKRTPDVCAI